MKLCRNIIFSYSTGAENNQIGCQWQHLSDKRIGLCYDVIDVRTWNREQDHRGVLRLQETCGRNFTLKLNNFSGSDTRLPGWRTAHWSPPSCLVWVWILTQVYPVISMSRRQGDSSMCVCALPRMDVKRSPIYWHSLVDVKDRHHGLPYYNLVEHQAWSSGSWKTWVKNFPRPTSTRTWG